MPKFFIDSHCHMFNLDDIAIYEFIRRLEISMEMRLGMRIGALLPSKLIKKALVKYKKFITFFESDRYDNILNTAKEMAQLSETWPDSLPPWDDRDKILTPLVMDFEMQQSHEKLWNQAHNLVKKIKEAVDDKIFPTKTKILPFLGVDMRRFWGHPTSSIEEQVDRFISSIVGEIKSPAEREDFAQLSSGDVIGIKFYPPLGFEPLPTVQEVRDKYLIAYRRLAQFHDFPFTVHCQEVSYSLSEDHERLTNPLNWEEVLQQDGCRNIRINFAHFGGSEELIDTIRWSNRERDGRVFTGIKEKTWTYTIIRMLKTYPNTYADISALDWKNRLTGIALKALIEEDNNNGFDELPDNHKIEDKLLWGSDYPMMLDNFDTYQELFTEFLKSLKTNKSGGKKFYPGAEHTEKLNTATFIEKIINKNPQKFLFKK